MKRIRATASTGTPTKVVLSAVSAVAARAYASVSTTSLAVNVAVAVAIGTASAYVTYNDLSYYAAPSVDIRADVYVPAQFIEAVLPRDENEKHIQPVYASETDGAYDGIDYINVIKVLQDSVTTTDNKFVSVLHHPIDLDSSTVGVEPDPVGASDFPAFNLSRPDVADSVTNSDFAAYHPQPVYSDTVATNDGIDYFVGEKILQDNAVTAASYIGPFVMTSVRSDSADTSDDKNFTVTHIETDAVASTDDKVFAVQPVLVDSVLTNETHLSIITKILSDVVATSDSADLLVIPLRVFGDGSSTSDNLVVAEITTAVDSRAVNGFAFNSTNFN